MKKIFIAGCGGMLGDAFYNVFKEESFPYLKSLKQRLQNYRKTINETKTPFTFGSVFKVSLPISFLFYTYIEIYFRIRRILCFFTENFKIGIKGSVQFHLKDFRPLVNDQSLH